MKVRGTTHLLTSLILLLHPICSQAQKKVEQCAVMEMDSLSRVRFPQRGRLSDFEQEVQSKVRELEALSRAGKTQATILSIPVVFHIIHSGEPVGSGTNLSQAQVASQIDVLNEDFRKMLGTPGYNSSPVGADIEIEFCLSPVDENGATLSEPGIHRYLGNKTSWTRDEIENSLKPTTIWNPNLFYNVWSVRFASSESNLLGYAQFPDQSGLSGLPASGPAATDGTVIRYQSIGSADKGTFPVQEAPYNKGRTLTHETGHWLGLRHIWGDGNCADDFVSDTPPASGPSSGCPTGRVSCGNTNMVENYMDYSTDACMNIFTIGQKARMQAVMAVSPRRKSLVVANLCSPLVAEVPTANFIVDRELVLKGGEATFTDLSTNFPNKWKWTFEGGDPASSTERNPKVKYATPGTYKVSLKASNSIGDSELLTRDAFIVVSQEGLCGQASNYLDTYTPSLLNMATYGPYTGFLTGHNSSGSKAVSEYFRNQAGYFYVSGVSIRFGSLSFENEEATARVVVWNARGPQNAPGSIIETKTILLRAIKEDIENDRPTTIVFDRETPVFNRPFQVGVELDYSSGASLAIRSSADGEAVNATSWVQNSAGKWSSYAIAYGANVAMDIRPLVGMNPSVQVSSSKLLIYPGEEVTLNGRGASIYVWETDDGTVSDFTGPQLKINPTGTVTVTATGSGLDLCNNTATTTIYLRENITGLAEDDLRDLSFAAFPNPGEELSISMSGAYRGSVSIQLSTLLGQPVLSQSYLKDVQEMAFAAPSTKDLPDGFYVITVRADKKSTTLKWLKALPVGR